MKRLGVKMLKKASILLEDTEAVLGLPMRLTVSLIIGTVALIAILSHILNPCLFPGKMMVSVTPLVTTISGEGTENVTFTVYVNDTTGHPLSGAAVIIKGLGGAGSGFTDINGKVSVQIAVRLGAGMYEGYLDISVKVACHESFERQDLIKVVKSSL